MNGFVFDSLNVNKKNLNFVVIVFSTRMIEFLTTSSKTYHGPSIATHKILTECFDLNAPILSVIVCRVTSKYTGVMGTQQVSKRLVTRQDLRITAQVLTRNDATRREVVVLLPFACWRRIICCCGESQRPTSAKSAWTVTTADVR